MLNADRLIAAVLRTNPNATIDDASQIARDQFRLADALGITPNDALAIMDDLADQMIARMARLPLSALATPTPE